jgi:hypothetical protein
MSSRSRIRFGEGQVCQLRVELEEIVPTIWRRVLLSDRASFHELHDVIERSMGRDPYRAYHFEVDGVRFDDPADRPLPGRNTDRVGVDALGLHVGARFLHLAENHGDPWRHVLTVERIEPRLVGQRLPVCIAGMRAAPPDDCAGPADYRAMLAAIADPTNPRSAEWRSWLPEAFDPEYADVTSINAALGKVPKHRPAA